MQGVPGYLRYRVWDRITGTLITDDLPHPHQSSWHIVGMQPGNPSNSAVGTFSVPLFPPGSPEYRKARPIYDQLAPWQRLEAYLGYQQEGIGLGKFFQGGAIVQRPSKYGPSSSFALSGLTDLAWAQYSRPFPGEMLSNDITSDVIQSFMGTNEASPANDEFNPFTAANYNSVALPGGTAGAWTADTDDGAPVVKCSTGTSCALISKVGAAANDLWHSQYVEVTGRLKPSSHASQAGFLGAGISSANNNSSNGVAGFVIAKLKNGRYLLDAQINIYLGGVLNSARAALNLEGFGDDPSGYIALTIGLLVTRGGQASALNSATLTVNGRVILVHQSMGYDPGTTTKYPYIVTATPASGTATCYVQKLLQFTRFSADGPSTAAVFAPGTIDASTNSLPWGSDPGPSLLDAWSQCATRDARYWRYTPRPFVPGSRTLGTVDYRADPGTDYGNNRKVVFSRGKNLIELELSSNSDPIASSTETSGRPTFDGGGASYWRDVAGMARYGVIEDQSFAFTAPNHTALRKASQQILSNKMAVGGTGAKTAIVLRDPGTMDKIRELDLAMYHDPEQGIYNQVARILARTFDEGATTEMHTLDQFSDTFRGLPYSNPHPFPAPRRR